MHKKIHFCRLWHRIEKLFHGINGRAGISDLDVVRIDKDLRNEPPDIVGHCRGKEQCLPLARDLGDNAPHRLDKPHVVHPVRFVKHKDFDMGEVDGPAFAMVKQAAGRRYNNVRALAQAPKLALDVDAAVDGDRKKVREPAIGAD